MSKAKVYVDGSVYSPADPYATAMVEQGGSIVWVGSDAGAESILDNSMEKVELGGNLLTPAFIHGFQRLETEQDVVQAVNKFSAAGYGGAVFATENPTIADSTPKGFDAYWLLEVISQPVLLPKGFHGYHWAGESLSREDFAVLSTGGAKVLSFSANHANELLKILGDHKPAWSDPVLRLENFSTWDSSELLSALAKHQVTVGVDVFATSSRDFYHRATESAIPYYLTADLSQATGLGWEIARIAIEQLGMSARAAFNSMTKGVARSLKTDPLMGQLVPDAPASYARWKVTELMVQTADSRVANWSTDPRARIPLLPVLEEGNIPELVSVCSPITQ